MLASSWSETAHFACAREPSSLTLSRNTALLLEGTYNRVEGADYLQAELALQLHF
ncbi:MAG: hypothetical protein JRG89_13145 [Deltaproteobacteria bacterium]|nr:hypothetical protein [Deltaproteobacteria bacterium]